MSGPGMSSVSPGDRKHPHFAGGETEVRGGEGKSRQSVSEPGVEASRVIVPATTRGPAPLRWLAPHPECVQLVLGEER